MTTATTATPARPPAATDAMLRATNVSVHFGGVSALDDVSISFAPSEICGVMGPNGAGKSTLFDVLSGVRRGSSGTLHLDGADVTTTSAVRRSRLGLRRTFQRQQTFGWLSVEDNLLVALESEHAGGLIGDMFRMPWRQRAAREQRARAEEVLELCGLADVATESAGTLDIGRARMVELARAIVSRPRVLLLDEPTSGLEERQTAQLGAIIEQLRAEGCAIALVEHDVAFMFEHCQRIVVLNLGSVLAAGTPEEIRADERVSAAYLG
ncbi:MAG: ABC transporter ATP-binding protein [Actinomycetota bacterium]|nr:ABC transporter ATP-binding protein [Actinomycetota bacterium]